MAAEMFPARRQKYIFPGAYGEFLTLQAQVQTTGFYINKNPPVKTSSVMQKTAGAAEIPTDIVNKWLCGSKRILLHENPVLSLLIVPLYHALTGEYI